MSRFRHAGGPEAGVVQCLARSGRRVGLITNGKAKPAAAHCFMAVRRVTRVVAVDIGVVPVQGVIGWV